MVSLKYFLLSPFVFLCLSWAFANIVPNFDDGSDFDVGVGPRAGPKVGLGAEEGISNARAGPRAGPRVEGGVSNVRAGPKAGPRAERGVSSIEAGSRAEGGVSNFRVGPKVGPMAGPRADGGVSGTEAGPRPMGGSAKRGADPIVNGLGVGVDIGYRPGFGVGIGGYWPGQGLGGLYNDCELGYVCPAYGRKGCNKFTYGTCETYGFHPLTASMDLHEVKINWAKSKPVSTTQNGV